MGFSEGYFREDGLPQLDEEESLATWLIAQITEDERVAREAASPSPWVVDDQQRDDRAIYGAARGATVAYDPAGDEDSKRDFAHIARWDPARVLAECDAKRRIIAACSAVLAVRDWEYDDAPSLAEETLKLLALPYVDREGFQDSWRI